MAYVAVRGGAEAIDASIEQLKYRRLRMGVSLDVNDCLAGMSALIGQVMSEASLYAPDLAALAIKQAEGSPEEAVFILRAYRSTVPRLHYTRELSTEDMRVERRISAAFKDIPGGQLLGSSTDYSHRLLDFGLAQETQELTEKWLAEFLAHEIEPEVPKKIPKVLAYLRREGLIAETAPNTSPPKDITTTPMTFPTSRSERLQALTRGQTGAVTALGYASFRAFGGGAMHATVGELRVGHLPIFVPNPLSESESKSSRVDDEDCYYIGEVEITEVESLIPVSIPRGEGRYELELEVGYGICFGRNETKAIAMSLLDHNLETGDLRYPTHNEELVLMHIDSVEATGFISHLKLPHYVTFQSKLDSLRKDRVGNTNNNRTSWQGKRHDQ